MPPKKAAFMRLAKRPLQVCGPCKSFMCFLNLTQLVIPITPHSGIISGMQEWKEGRSNEAT